MSPDAGIVDSGVGGDAGPVTDSGVTRDGGPQRDGGPERDGGPGRDGGVIGGADFYFVASSDGTSTRRRVYAAEVGMDPVPLSEVGPIQTMTLSSDGTTIAFSGPLDDSRITELWTVSTVPGAQPIRVSQDFIPNRGPGVANPRWSPTAARLLYVAGDDSPRELYAVDPDGTNRVRLNADLMSGSVAFERWTPSGDRVVYRAPQDTAGRAEIYSVRPDGTDPQKVNAPITDTVDDWFISPDSTQVAYLAFETRPELALHVVGIDGSNPLRVSRAPVAGGTLSSSVDWRSDGSRLAFIGDLDVDDAHTLYTVRPDGTDHVSVATLSVPPASGIGRFAWSPDGDYLAYGVYNVGPGTWSLYAGTPDGKSSTLLSGTHPLLSNTGEFIWSSNSRHIAYRADPEGDGEAALFVANVDGTTVQVSPTAPVGRYDVADFMVWSPDGAQISYFARTDTGRGLYAVDFTGTNHVELTATLGVAVFAIGAPLWSADSSRVAFSAQNGTDAAHLYVVGRDGAGFAEVSTAVGPMTVISAFLFAD